MGKDIHWLGKSTCACLYFVCECSSPFIFQSGLDHPCFLLQTLWGGLLRTPGSHFAESLFSSGSVFQLSLNILFIIQLSDGPLLLCGSWEPPIHFSGFQLEHILCAKAKFGVLVTHNYCWKCIAIAHLHKSCHEMFHNLDLHRANIVPYIEWRRKQIILHLSDLNVLTFFFNNTVHGEMFRSFSSQSPQGRYIPTSNLYITAPELKANA